MISLMDMLWFKFILGLMFFQLVSILLAIVPDHGNEYMTKENKNGTSFQNFAPKLNLNHNRYISVYDKLWELSCFSESQESELKVKSSFQRNVLHLTPVIMILQKNCVHWGSTMSRIIMRTDQSQWLGSRPWLLNSLSSQLIYGCKSNWKLDCKEQ